MQNASKTVNGINLATKFKGRFLVSGALALLILLALTYSLWFRTSLQSRDALLNLMPADAQSVFFVDLAQLGRAPFFADLLAWAPNPNADAEYIRFVHDTGFDYEKDLVRVAIGWQQQSGQSVFFAVADGRFDQKKIKAYALNSGATKSSTPSEIFLLPVTPRRPRLAFSFLRDDRIALTNANDFAALLRSQKNPDAVEWQTRFERVAGSPFFAVIRSEGLRAALTSNSSAQSLVPQAPGGFASPQLSALLQQLQWLSIAGKPENDTLKVVAEAESVDENNVRQLTDMLNGMVLLGRAGLSNVRIDPATRAAYISLLKTVEISRIDRGDTKSVRIMFDINSKLLAPSKTQGPWTP